MASITLTIDDSIALRVLNKFCLRKGYTGFLADGVTPQTKIDFLKADLSYYIKRAVLEQEAGEASVAASIAAAEDVETNITIS